MSTPRKKRSTKRPGPVAARRPAAPVTQPAMLAEVRDQILTARQQVAQVVNAGLIILYWQIGTRIRKDILKEQRAAYGKEIIPELGRQLEAEWFTPKAFANCSPGLLQPWDQILLGS